jgi:hypothetical protein
MILFMVILFMPFSLYVENIVDELCIAIRLRWHSRSTKPEKTLASRWLTPASRWFTLYSQSTRLRKILQQGRWLTLYNSNDDESPPT